MQDMTLIQILLTPIHLTETGLDFWDKMQNQQNRQTSITTDWEQYNTEFVASMNSRRYFFAAMGNAVAIREIAAGEARNKPFRRKKPQ